MGPFKVNSSIHWQLEWAHPMPMAAFVGSRNGPIQAHWQYASVVAMGPFRSIGNITLHLHWAHPFISAILFMGPSVTYNYFTKWVHLDFSDLFEQFARGLYRARRHIVCHGLIVNASNQYKVCLIIRGLHWTNGLFLWVKVIRSELPFTRDPCCENSPIESSRIAIAGI